MGVSPSFTSTWRRKILQKHFCNFALRRKISQKHFQKICFSCTNKPSAAELHCSTFFGQMSTFHTEFSSFLKIYLQFFFNVFFLLKMLPENSSNACQFNCSSVQPFKVQNQLQPFWQMAPHPARFPPAFLANLFSTSWHRDLQQQPSSVSEAFTFTFSFRNGPFPQFQWF